MPMVGVLLCREFEARATITHAYLTFQNMPTIAAEHRSIRIASVTQVQSVISTKDAIHDDTAVDARC